MHATLSIFSILLSLLGTILVGLDAWQPSLLMKIKGSLLAFSSAVKKMNLIPRDPRRIAFRRTIVQTLTLKIHPNKSFDEMFLENLEKIEFDPDLNLNISYRSVVYIFAEVTFLGIFLFIWYLNGFDWLASRTGLHALAVYLALSLGLIGGWLLEVLNELPKESNKLPLIYRIPFLSSRSVLYILPFVLVHFIINVLAKLIEVPIRVALSLETVARPNQSPRILGILLLLLAGIIQIVLNIV